MMEETMEEEDICRSDAADSAFSFIRRKGRRRNVKDEKRLERWYIQSET